MIAVMADYLGDCPMCGQPCIFIEAGDGAKLAGHWFHKDCWDDPLYALACEDISSQFIIDLYIKEGQAGLSRFLDELAGRWIIKRTLYHEAQQARRGYETSYSP